MLPKDLRRKLSQIQRGEEPNPDQQCPRPDVQPQAGEGISALWHAAVPLEYDPQSLGRPVSNEAGEFFLAEYPAAALGIALDISSPTSPRPESCLFLDIETTGLSSAAPLFLVGLMMREASGLRIAQLFARDYTEEPALLMHLGEIASNYRTLVTFNGKTFDMPYIRDRAAYNRVRLVFEHEHLDLLHIARRTWRADLPNCRLQTLEEFVCSRRRLDDTPGNLIPELYHRFVRNGDWNPLRGVFFHNALDLLTMAELMSRRKISLDRQPAPISANKQELAHGKRNNTKQAP